MATDNVVPINEEHINRVMGIPSIEVLEAHVIETLETMLRLASSLAQDVAALCSWCCGLDETSSIPCPQTAQQVEYQPRRETPDKQPSTKEMVPQDSLAPTPHSLIGMEASPAATDSQPLPPQSHAKSSLPPELRVEEALENDGTGGNGSQSVRPSSMRRFKQTTKRIIKRPLPCKSLFFAQCVKQFPKIPHVDRIVADYALVENCDPSEILCEMYGMYITQEEMSYLNAGRWVNSMVVLSNLKANATSQVIMYRCRMCLDVDILGCDLGRCDMLFIPVCENNHWHIHVVNFPAGQVEIFSSLPLQRGNNISASTRRLSMAIHKALHAHGIQMDLDVSTFVHVQPHLVQQLNRYDCGILALKFMEFWNGATLSTSLAEDKMHMYRLQLVVKLLLNEQNSIRDKIMDSCQLGLNG
ncbi:hypothetical protein VitviT2T_019913 [Vitis vinifera]|uniref:Ubiquitin-like protease family profile domain-containing protein n=1 Tax=Vitis vinifera TaxID=29760 RepID=A0ABY9D2F1_VITVI|nr:hypothetical protein VitviT2T_019913 [Vitis vinifera]